MARLTDEAAQQRRAARSDRDEVTVRARMLLDTLGEAVVGLRRELALPAASRHARASGSRRRTPTTRAPTPGPPLVEDSARLAQYLALPRPRLIVDGYNVTKTAWPALSLEAQRGRLLTLLGALRPGPARRPRSSSTAATPRSPVVPRRAG